jgi:hypothetical protein
MDHEPELAIDRDVPKLDTAGKRALIEKELRDNPQRSNHAIARAVGPSICHKTVAAARERLGIASRLGNSPPTPTEQRHMLIAAATDFNKRYPPGPSETGTAEEQVDEAIAKGVVKLAPGDPDLEVYWQIPRQAAIECRALVGGGVEIWQEGQHGGGDDVIIHVAAANVVNLARLMLYAAGFKNIGIYTHERGGNVDIDDGHLASNYYEDDNKHGYGPVR